MGANPNARFSRPHASPAECARLGSRDDSPHCMVHISRIYYMSSKCAGGGDGRKRAMWRSCSCGRTFCSDKPSSLKASLSRCRAKHPATPELVLDAAPDGLVADDAMAFLILGHQGAQSSVRGLKQQLSRIGVDKHNVRVVYGFRLGDAVIRGHLAKRNEICHYSVLHKWIPRLVHWLSVRRQIGIVTHSVWLLESDAQLIQRRPVSDRASPGREILTKADLASMASKSSVCWPGYRRVDRGGFYERTYGFPFHVVGSHAISFKGDGCCMLQACLMSSTRYCHLDALLTRGLPSYYLPSVSCIGTRSNKKALHDAEKTEANYSREAFLKRHRLQVKLVESCASARD